MHGIQIPSYPKTSTVVRAHLPAVTCTLLAEVGTHVKGADTMAGEVGSGKPGAVDTFAAGDARGKPATAVGSIVAGADMFVVEGERGTSGKEVGSFEAVGSSVVAGSFD
jgi:hypothetical protein